MRKCFSSLLIVALATVVGCASNPSDDAINSGTQPPGASSKATASASKAGASSKATAPASKAGASSKATEAKPEKPKTVAQRLHEMRNDHEKRKVTNGVAIENYFKFRDSLPATNRTDRALVELAVLSACRIPGWTSYKRWDKTLADKYMPQLGKPAVADAALPVAIRIDYANHYCLWLAGEKRFDEADKIADKLIADALKLDRKERARSQTLYNAYNLKKNCRRWCVDYDGAMAAAKESVKYNSGMGRSSATRLAFEFDRPDDAMKVWDGAPVWEKLDWFRNNQRAGLVRDLAIAYAMCPTNPPARRSTLTDSMFLTEKTPEAAKVRAAVKDVYKPDSYWLVLHNIKNLYVKGDWAFFAEIYEYAHVKQLDNAAGHRAFVFALVASGQTAKALAKADEYLKDEKLDKRDRAKLEALKAVARDQDALVPLAAIKDDAKAYAEAVRNVATWCLNLEKNEAARRYSDLVQTLVKTQTIRRYGVRWFDTPVTSISDWRRIWDQLEKTYTDKKMYGDLEVLETDVATGRITIEKTEKDTVGATFEVTSLCDVNGLSIFLRVEDPNARLVEKGLAGGLGTEMYFAPGDNQPYTCFGSDPRTGVAFDFPTTYENIDHKRLNVKGPRDRYSLQSEVAFTDTDYVLRLFFPWDAFYQKLPTKGTEWKYDCLNFGPGGNFSWGGSLFVHEASNWGRLVFDLTPAQERAIKRRLIYASYKSWNVGSHGEVAPFDKWADPVIGDPDFYKFIKPLETELVGYQKRVAAEMSDADVDEIYAKGVIRWMGIRHEIDKLRKDYLLTK